MAATDSLLRLGSATDEKWAKEDRLPKCTVAQLGGCPVIEKPRAAVWGHVLRCGAPCFTSTSMLRCAGVLQLQTRRSCPLPVCKRCMHRPTNVSRCNVACIGQRTFQGRGRGRAHLVAMGAHGMCGPTLFI
jgi:hypothetical protein